MKEKILIVEDQFIEADYLKLMLTNAGYKVCGMARSVALALEIVEEEKPELVLLDIFLMGPLTGIDLAKHLKKDNIPFVYLSANSNEEILKVAKATDPSGFLVKPFREKDLLVTLEIAFYRHRQGLEAISRVEAQVRKELNRIQDSEGNWNQKLLKTAAALQQYIPFDGLAIKFKARKDTSFRGLILLRISFDEYQILGIEELSVISGLKLEELRFQLMHTPPDGSAGWYNGDDFKKLFADHPLKALLARTFGFCSNLVLPFLSSDGYFFSMSFFRRMSEGYSAENLDGLSRLQEPIGSVVNSISAVEKRNALSMKFNAPPSPVEVSLDSDFHFEGVVGGSSAFLNVMDLIGRVAPIDTSVLILGETGTGKEKIADCIHNLSPRKDKPLIKVNCAAMAPTLIESELFGHEKGAFTGASEKRIGKFEQANYGTIFLDEIGDLPSELQVKLLRTLQEKEVQRIGAKSVTKIDVRIIAATNRNLEKEVAEGRFRLDLYYRLNVFPIELPPLRDRREDIPAFISHFIKYYSRKAGRRITSVSEAVMNKMMSYNWPGNIRELAHLIERNVLLAKGEIIDNILLPEVVSNGHTDAGHLKTIQENERDHILLVLKNCNGRIWGPGAAAEILNLPPSTLKSKMKKLGIKKEYIK